MNPYFEASQNLNKSHPVPVPQSFWELDSNLEPFWNHLQKITDQHFNPMLHPNSSKRRFNKSTSYEFLLRQSFSEVSDVNSIKRNFDKLPQQIQDFVRNMQKRDYPTLIEPNGVCGVGAKQKKEASLLLLAIKTKELNFKNRQAIRQTWGKQGWVAAHRPNSSRGKEGGAFVRRVFLLGKENPEELGVNISELLQQENNLYGDILQWDFRDTFFNLTLKDVLFWRWFSNSCDRTHFVFKGDEDVFVNTPKMITHLKELLKEPKARSTMKDFMVGDVIRGATPNRLSSSKYYIPHSFYKGTYPLYAGGGGVVYSGLLTKRLYNMSKKIHLFPIDDVYVGMCMFQLNASPIHHPAFLTFDFPKKEKGEPCLYHRIMLVHKRSPQQLIKLWADMNNTYTQCKDMPLRS
ncbi:N-acetyllactosaminide beta-1,3-N-acetylglucosaminyltransferase 2-like [Echeneis naucrates]|nr:N-acetyllactosaminide beta-1,3-N-acetylglucosaminyltransferase 2-like [Echeneis naucrates]